MIYLLAQITACLVLAAIVGWFTGWSWRGFRDQDRLEDARHTLRLTEEIKNRELTEAYRQADAARAQADTLRRQLESRDQQRHEQGLQATSSEASRDVQQRPDAVMAAGEAAAPGGGAMRHVVALAAIGPGGAAGRDAPAPRSSADVPATDRQDEADAALREKTAAVLALQAQVRALRTSADAGAEETARMEARLIELEPLAQQLFERNRQIDELERSRNAIAAEQEEDRHRADGLEAQIGDTRRQLQRQIERNRKQDAVHRSVVDELQRRLSKQKNAGELAALRLTINDPDRLQHPRPEVAEDDLQQIRGIGPKLSIRLRELGIWSFAQIAQWTPADVARISRQIGAFPDRIRRDGWVQGARRLLQAP